VLDYPESIRVQTFQDVELIATDVRLPHKLAPDGGRLGAATLGRFRGKAN